MSTKTFELYVGSNNKTGVLEIEKITEVTLKYYDGASIHTGVIGIWRGGQEKTARVLVVSDLQTLEKYIKELKKVLHQEEIAYHQVNKLKFK